MVRRWQYPLPIWALVLAVLVFAPVLTSRAAALCFPETGQCTGDAFSTFWQTNGGLPVFGFPVAPLAPESNRDDDRTYLTQWYERERLELHPDNAAPYTTLLGRLGAERLQQQNRDWTTFPKASPNAAHYYGVTGHAIGSQFWNYWRAHGLDLGDPGVSERESLALFGYPLSEPAMERNSSGDMVLTQWFERARFEYHPAKPAAYRVLLGLLGSEVRPAGIPTNVPRYEDRMDATGTMLSYYNAINRREYHRAYDYWEQPGTSPSTTPPDYPTFVQGYMNTASIAITVGTPSIEPGAGNVFAGVPTVIVATQVDGARQVFAGCYVLHHTNPGADPRPDAELWKLRDASISAAPSTATPATLLGALRCPA